MSLVSIGLKSREKSFTIPFNPFLFIYLFIYLFILLIVKSFEILPKHNV